MYPMLLTLGPQAHRDPTLLYKMVRWADFLYPSGFVGIFPSVNAIFGHEIL